MIRATISIVEGTQARKGRKRKGLRKRKPTDGFRSLRLRSRLRLRVFLASVPASSRECAVVLFDQLSETLRHFIASGQEQLFLPVAENLPPQ